jgi:hypothetical protein
VKNDGRRTAVLRGILYFMYAMIVVVAYMGTESFVVLARNGFSSSADILRLAFSVWGFAYLIFDIPQRMIALSYMIRGARIRRGIDQEGMVARVEDLRRVKDASEERIAAALAATDPDTEAILLSEAASLQEHAKLLLLQLEPEVDAAKTLTDEYEQAIARAEQFQKRALISRLASFAASRRKTAAVPITAFAAFLAGRKREGLREAWLADLHGAPEAGISPSDRERFALALGNVVAALRMRANDLVAPLWRRVEWVVSSNRRTNVFVALVVGAAVVYFDRADGLHALLREDGAACALLCSIVKGLAHWARRVRGIELAEKPPTKRSG